MTRPGIVAAVLATLVAAPVLAIDASFIIGAPGRLDSEDDRRLPRRCDRADSAVAACADVEVVSDPTWLQHEIESYARRALGCDRFPAVGCRRETRRVGGAPVLYVAAGSRAELIWMAAGGRAVRLGWRRVIEAPTGTVTIDAPPQGFADTLFGELPSRLTPIDAGDAAWAAAEAARLRYYDEARRARSAAGDLPWCSADVRSAPTDLMTMSGTP